MQKSNWFFGSSEVLLIFTVTAGYFMAAHFQKRKADPAYMARSASSRAWEYTWARVKSLLPVLILGYVLGAVSYTHLDVYKRQGEMFGRRLQSEAEICDCAARLQAGGAQNVLVSMAGDVYKRQCRYR